MAYHARDTVVPLFVPGDSRSYTYDYNWGLAFRWDNFVKIRFRIKIATVSGSTNDAMLIRFTNLAWAIDTSKNDANHMWLELTRLQNIANYSNNGIGEMFLEFSHTDLNTVRLGPAGEGSLGAGSTLEGSFCYFTDQQ